MGFGFRVGIVLFLEPVLLFEAGGSDGRDLSLLTGGSRERPLGQLKPMGNSREPLVETFPFSGQRNSQPHEAAFCRTKAAPSRLAGPISRGCVAGERTDPSEYCLFLS